MTYRPRLEIDVLRQMRGLPDEAFDTLVGVVASICEDPYDRMASMPVTADGRVRMAELGDSGFIEFTVEEPAGLVRVFHLVWTS